MPLMEMTIMDQKVHFILLLCANIYSITDLCKEFGVSRGTGYRYVRKYQEGGMIALELQSRAPHNRSNKTLREIEEKILEYRKQHTYSRYFLDIKGIYRAQFRAVQARF